MAKRVDIAKRLEDLGFDPVATMVKIIAAAEEAKNHSLAGKMTAELLQYTAPKLKSIEYSVGQDTMDFLDRVTRRRRIRELLTEVGKEELLAEVENETSPVEAEFRVLNHKPDKP